MLTVKDFLTLSTLILAEKVKLHKQNIELIYEKYIVLCIFLFKRLSYRCWLRDITLTLRKKKPLNGIGIVLS